MERSTDGPTNETFDRAAPSGTGAGAVRCSSAQRDPQPDKGVPTGESGILDPRVTGSTDDGTSRASGHHGGSPSGSNGPNSHSGRSDKAGTEPNGARSNRPDIGAQSGALENSTADSNEPGAPRVEPPYWAVIFVTTLRDPAPGYEQAARTMLELAASQPGFLGVESARDECGRGITISYWRAPEDFERWRDHTEHAATRNVGRERWYESYELRWARVERQVSWNRSQQND